jgi:murein DD-endopeptidase MepM/ murein hydrolase activator NlpD
MTQMSVYLSRAKKNAFFMKKLGLGFFLFVPLAIFAVAALLHQEPENKNVSDDSSSVSVSTVAEAQRPKTCEERQDGQPSASLKGHDVWKYLCNHKEDVYTVSSGDTFAKLLSERGLSSSQAHEASQAVRRLWDTRELNVGQDVHFLYPLEGKASLKGLYLLSDPTHLVVLKRTGQDFTADLISVPSTTTMVYKESRITSSLFDAANQSGVPTNILIDMIRAFSYDVDFQREVKEGNTFSVFYETVQDNNKKVLSSRNIAYASMRLNDRFLRIYAHKTKDGSTVFYFRDGSSTRKALLKTPVDGVRISSTFGMRMHPILGYSKMHKGIDFAAPRGTPIRAAGNGRVVYMGRFGAYGNYLKIKHNDNFSTAYAHIHNFPKGMRVGQTVKQGQLVAFIGTTGRSTGPHLHYEILKNGAQVNPQSVKLPTSEKLSSAEMKRFRQTVAKVEMQMAAQGKVDTAQLVQNR